MNQSTIIIRSNQVAPDSRVEKEAAALVEQGHYVKILAWDRRSTHPESLEEISAFGYDIPIVRFGHKANFGEGLKSIGSYLGFQWSVFKWLVKNRREFDVIHACDFDTALTSTIANFFLKKKYIFDIFDYLGGERANLAQKILCAIQNFIINRSDATIICTEKRLAQIRPSSPKKLVVIHNTPPKAGEKDAFIPPHNPVKICYVGILQDFRLLEELPEFFITHPEYEFHIGGFGKFESLYKDLSERYSNIKFYGSLQYQDTLQLEKDCDIMLAIYDPKIENHIFAAPNKFYEGLMLGKPLVMVHGTGMSEIVEKYRIGETIDYSVESFAQGISRLVARKNKWPEICSKMHDIYNDYSWDEMKQRLANLYAEF